MTEADLFELRPDKTTEDKKEKMYLTERGKDFLDALLKKLPPKTDLSQITGVSISSQALYNYINYDKPISRKGNLACLNLVKYFSEEEKQIRLISLEIAIKVVKRHGGKVIF